MSLVSILLGFQFWLAVAAAVAAWRWRGGGDGSMVVTAVWHPNSLGDNTFAKNAEKLWNGIVNWRTATAFDAMQVVIAGLRENPTRNGLQQVLSQQGFSVNNGTATGTVKFLPSGDREGATILLKVQPSNSQTGYDFAPL